MIFPYKTKRDDLKPLGIVLISGYGKPLGNPFVWNRSGFLEGFRDYKWNGFFSIPWEKLCKPLIKNEKPITKPIYFKSNRFFSSFGISPEPSAMRHIWPLQGFYCSQGVWIVWEGIFSPWGILKWFLFPVWLRRFWKGLETWETLGGIKRI